MRILHSQKQERTSPDSKVDLTKDDKVLMGPDHCHRWPHSSLYTYHDGDEHHFFSSDRIPISLRNEMVLIKKKYVNTLGNQTCENCNKKLVSKSFLASLKKNLWLILLCREKYIIFSWDDSLFLFLWWWWRGICDPPSYFLHTFYMCA